MDSLQITLNGEPRAVAVGATLADLVTQLALDSRKVAIEQNRVIVARSQYAGTAIRTGDEIEVVAFIGGG